MCRPPTGDLCDAEDVNHKARGHTKDDSLLLIRCATNSSSSVSSRHKVGLNCAIEGPSLPRRVGGVFLPSTSAATNGRFFESGELCGTVVSEEGFTPAGAEPCLRDAGLVDAPGTSLFTLSCCDPGESWLRPGWTRAFQSPAPCPPARLFGYEAPPTNRRAARARRCL